MENAYQSPVKEQLKSVWDVREQEIQAQPFGAGAW